MNSKVRICNVYRILAILLSACLGSLVHAQDEKPVTYGNLVLVDEEGEGRSGHKVALTGGFDTSDPLMDIYSGTLYYSYEFQSFFELGAMARFFESEKTALLQTVESEFGLLGVEIASEQPKQSYYLRLGLVPLKGRLNFFGVKTLLYNFSVHFGPGQRITDRSTYWGYYWAVQSSVGLSDSTSLLIIFDQEAEAGLASRETIFRDQINLGLSYAF